MKVIIIKEVKGLGKPGQVVEVSDGHARNLLLPKGFAKEATEQNIKALDKIKADEANKRQNDLASAKIVAENIKDLDVKIHTKAGEGGKLFGAVTSKDIADALQEQFGITIDKRKFVIENPIKHVGEFIIDIKLYQDIIGKLKISVGI
jgi:large subunit ribosomal protein L9